MANKKRNSYCLSKKGMSLFFLMELLILACIIIIFAGFAYRVTTSESKMLTFDSENLGLFLDRIPSIEGNFRYVFVFNKSVNVDFTKDTIRLDKATIDENKKYGLRYYNPAGFQIEGKFKNITTLYFYKIGDQLYVEKNQSDALDKKLTNRETSNINWTGKNIDFYASGDNTGQIKSTASFVFEKSAAKFNSGKELSETIGTNPNTFVWMHIENETMTGSKSTGKKFIIYYNNKASTIANNWQNVISNFISIGNDSRRTEVEMYPLSDYADIKNEMSKQSLEYNQDIKTRLDTIPVIITKSNAFGEYAIALRE